MLNSLFYSSLLFFFCPFFLASAQGGCTDPVAINYDPNALFNDGSCIYAPTSYQPQLIAPLSDTLAEASGIVALEQEAWVQNDGGNLQKIYRINLQNGTIAHQTILVGAINTDWEDLATDGNYLYVGDFGNNYGNRTDLKIYKTPINQINQSAATTEIIAFSYEDQQDFSAAFNQNNYDCEAFFYANDSLHLFTKRWLDYKTYHYTIPTEPGQHTALLRDSFTADALITGADIDAEGHILLLGFSPITQNAILWLLYDYPQGHLFDGNKRRIDLGSPFHTGQLEGICFTGPWEGYLVAETFATLPPQLLRFNLVEIVSSLNRAEELVSQIDISPNPLSGTSLFLSGSFSTAFRQIQLHDLQGQLLREWSWNSPKPPPFSIEIDWTIPFGIYVLTAKTNLETKSFLLHINR